jgi:AcrR family transcriptional regulator
VEHGYEPASTNRIVQRFGGSKATLFRYFPSKQALLEAVVQRVAAQWRETVDVKSIPALEKIFRGTAGRPLIAAISSRLRLWNRSGYLASREPERDAVRFLDLLVAGMVSRRLYGEASPSAARLEAHIKGGVALFLHGCEGAGAPGNSRVAGSSAPRRRRLSR